MSVLKEQLVDKAQEILANPTTAKVVSTYTVGVGSAVGLDVIQGWLGIISAGIGIGIGILVFRIKLKELKRMDREEDFKDGN